MLITHSDPGFTHSYVPMDISGLPGAEDDELSTVEDDTGEMGPSPSPIDGAELADDLLIRCRGLLNELKVFQEYLEQQKREHSIEIKPFRNSITAELKSLERVSRPGMMSACHDSKEQLKILIKYLTASAATAC